MIWRRVDNLWWTLLLENLLSNKISSLCLRRLTQRPKLMCRPLEHTGLLCLLGAVWSLPISVSLTDAMLMLGALLCLSSEDYRRALGRAFIHPICLTSGLIIFLSLLLSIQTLADWHDWSSRLSKLSKFLELPFVMAAFMRAPHQASAYRGFTLGLIATAALSIGYQCLVQFLPDTASWIFMHRPFHHHFFQAPDTIFHDHIVTSHMMSLGVASILIGKFYKQAWVRSTRWWLGLGLMLMVIFWINESRMGYLLMLTLFGLVCIQTQPKKRLFMALLGLPILAGTLYWSSPTLQTKLQTTWTNVQAHHHNQDDTSIGRRMTLFQNATKLIRDSPIIGCGTGCFHQAYQRFDAHDATKSYFTPENEYLLYGVQWGMFGIIALLAWFSIGFMRSLSLPAPWRHQLQCVLVSVMVSNLSTASISSNSIGTLLIVLTGLILAKDPRNGIE